MINGASYHATRWKALAKRMQRRVVWMETVLEEMRHAAAQERGLLRDQLDRQRGQLILAREALEWIAPADVSAHEMGAVAREALGRLEP